MGKDNVKKKHAGYVRNFVFGVEDSLVSTVGMLSGVAVAGLPRRDIILAGIVLIFVEAFSMGVGSTLSEETAEEFVQHKDLPLRTGAIDGVIMFFSYFLAGFIPLVPYIILQSEQAFWVSIIFSLIALFILGLVAGKFFHISLLKHGLRMLLIGGFAILVGVVVGAIVQ